ncbi:hypothetical protein [Umezawaea beigongshangensis]|uniref:hypothetical protein n=1 Tax=Umezawaea beigongshangensis TaxID=2780383 RepID=UPI0018F202D8|nr:hypothetical protein [Umezawaea beigongshangensis]
MRVRPLGGRTRTHLSSSGRRRATTSRSTAGTACPSSWGCRLLGDVGASSLVRGSVATTALIGLIGLIGLRLVTAEDDVHRGPHRLAVGVIAVLVVVAGVVAVPLG